MGFGGGSQGGGQRSGGGLQNGGFMSPFGMGRGGPTMNFGGGQPGPTTNPGWLNGMLGQYGYQTAGGAPDYYGAAGAQSNAQQGLVDQQTANNRPNQYNDFGSSEWTMGPDGRPVQTTSMNPEDKARLESWRGQQQQMYGASGGLINGLHDLNQPELDYGKLGSMGTGEDARNQAISAAYNQASSRLDPRFKQEEGQLQSQLANQGLDPGSEVYQTEMGNFGRNKNDAYTSAMNGAIGQGTAAGNAIFQQNLARRQQLGGEMMNTADFSRSNQRYNQGRQMQELGMLLGQENAPGLPQFSGFNASGVAEAPNYLGAAGMMGNYGLGSTQVNNQAYGQANADIADMWGGIMGGIGQGLGGLSSGGQSMAQMIPFLL